MTVPHRFVVPGAQLRLFPRDDFAADDAPPLDAGGSPPLSALVPLYVAAKNRRRPRERPLTREYVACLEAAAKKWAAATGDPPLDRVGPATAAAFADWLAGQELATETIRKECRHVQALLDFAGPSGPTNRDGPEEAGYFGLRDGWPRAAPTIPAPIAGDPQPKAVWSDADVDAFRAACGWARKPRLPECPPDHWWRSAIDVVAGTGIRRRTLLALQRSWLDPTTNLLHVPGWAVKPGRPVVIYASALVRDALAAMPTGETVFPWPYRVKGLPNWSMFHAEFRRILSFSLVPEEKRRKAGVHAPRRGLGDTLWPMDKTAAQDTLGHTAESTTREHYTQAVTRALAAGVLLEQRAAEIRAQRRTSD